MIEMTDRDISKARSILKSPQLRPEWKKEIEVILELKKKAEIQAFASFSLDYVPRVYLPQKINGGDFYWTGNSRSAVADHMTVDRS
jgi:DNA topoisomerase VI subunit A